ncbi:MAG TPA: hypothetical protein VK446_08300 [Methylocystis sp.]|nr:hypothetical protein [Methylocystis sp.]
MRKIVQLAAALSLIILSSPPAADASSRHHAQRSHAHARQQVVDARRPLNIERRSFLDPGTQVPVGYGRQYVDMPAYVWGDPVATYHRSWFMDENLHQAFDPQPRRFSSDFFGLNF